MPTLDWQSLNLDQERKEQMQRLFPELFADWELDPSQLKKYFGEYYEGEERYGINRAGKNSAIQVIKHRTSQTLHPDKDSSVDRDKTGNIFIEGDNLDALRILQKSYYGKIKMIYLDPPYNTGNDNFVYPDDFSQTQKEYAKASGQIDQDGNLTKDSFWKSNTKDSGKYHSNWLGMMYPRLFLAKNLLRDDWVMFVSIDDNEIYNLRIIMNEIFWEENFIGTFIRQSKVWGGSDSKHIVKEHEYCVWFAKNINNLPDFFIEHDQEYLKRYKEQDGKWRFFRDTFARPGLQLKSDDKESLVYEITFPDNTKQKNRWIRSKETFQRNLKDWEIRLLKKDDWTWSVQFKQYLNEEGKKPRSLTSDLWSTIDWKNNIRDCFNNDKLFSYPKPIKLVSFLAKMTTKSDDIILDFFAWSWTTAHAVMDLNTEDEGNRKFILVQYPELTDVLSEPYKLWYKKISDICKERIRKAGKWIKKEKWLRAATLDIGFKAFVVNESNFKVRRPEDINDQTLISQLDLFTNNTKDGTDKLSMLYELMLKRWIDLNTKVAPSTFEKFSYYYLGDGELVVCLDGKVDQKLMDHIIWLKPQMVVMLDKAFEWNDQLLSNTNLQMKAKEITFQTL